MRVASCQAKKEGAELQFFNPVTQEWEGMPYLHSILEPIRDDSFDLNPITAEYKRKYMGLVDKPEWF